jgi:hypothetical protein
MTTIAEEAILNSLSVKLFFFIFNILQYIQSFSIKSKLGYQKSLETGIEPLMLW